MEEQEIDLKAILGLLRRQFRVILVTFLVVMALAGGAILVLKPIYTASTLVMVDPSRKDLLDAEAQMMSTASDSARIDSEVELVRSDTTLLRAIEQGELIDDPEFGARLGLRDRLMAFLRIAQPTLPTGDEALQAVLTKLRNAVSVQRRGLTYLISIQARSLSPERAAFIANTTAEAYIDEQLEAKIRSVNSSQDLIRSRLEAAEAAVTAAEAAFDELIQSSLDTIVEETGRTDLAEARRQIEELATSRRVADATLAEASRSLEQRDWGAVADQLRSEALARLESDRRALEATLAGETAGSERAIDLRQELASLESELRTTATSELGALREELVQTQANLSDLRVQLRSRVLDGNLPNSILTNLFALQTNAETARTQYLTMLGRVQDLETEAALQVADSRIVAEALPPATPSFPNPRLILALAGLAGLGLGVGLAFLVENFIGGFTSEGQLRSVLGTNVAATVPRQKPIKTAGSGELGVSEHVTAAPLSVFAEAVRRIRVGLDQALHRVKKLEEPGAVVMVTSAAPGDGKTTLALSLARSYALSGRATLLIDCDLRKPSVHRQLGLEPSSGLLDYLTDEDEKIALKSIMTVDHASDAQIILGARRSDFSTEQLIVGPTFTRLVDAAKKSFDVIIFDTPPLGPVVDGVYLAPLADAVVFAIKWASTSQQDARQAITMLEGAKRPETEIIAVLNQQDISKSAYRNKYAGYYAEA